MALLAIGPACGPGDGGAAPLLVEPGTPVVLVVIDTLRADRLSCYGYELETSPAIDALAEQAFVFGANATQCNATFSSLTSIMTGLYPRTHRNYVPVPTAEGAREVTGAASLAERFRARGYHTLAVVSHPFWSDEGTSMASGWDVRSQIEAAPQERVGLANARHTNERLLPLLDAHARRDDGRPLFLWVHYFDPHTDGRSVYAAPPATRDLFLEHHLRAAGLERYLEPLRARAPGQRMGWIGGAVPEQDRAALLLANGRALYDAEVRAADMGVGALLRRLRRMGLFHRALIVVMADHGENLEAALRADLQFTHNGLYEGVVHTPLIVKLPGQRRAARVQALTQNIDVAATLIELLGLPDLPAVEGMSLVPLLADPSARVHERVFVESSDNVDRAVKTDELKLIHHGGEAPSELYAWRRDPGEREDLGQRVSAGLVEELERAVEDFRPRDVVRVRIAPRAEPFEATLVLELADGGVGDASGAPGATLSPDRRRFVWQGTVAEEPVELSLALQRYNVEMRWSLRLPGVERPERSVWLGRRPLVETTALPCWSPGSAPAPAGARLVIERHAADGSVGLEVRPREGERVDVELRYAQAGYERTFEALLLEGFAPLEAADAGVVRTRARGPDPAVALVRPSDPAARAYPLVRFDGRWPDPERVALDGRAVSREVLEFVFPHPVDGRITAALMAGAPEPPAPGGVAIWLEMGGGGGQPDAALLDEASAELLRSLGYAR